MGRAKNGNRRRSTRTNEHVKTTPSNRHKAFPLRLWDALEDPDCSLISWTKDGTCIAFDQPHGMAFERAAEKHFGKGANWTNIHRQLNYYNFSVQPNVLVTTPQKLFYNPGFQRTFRDLAVTITRKRKTKKDDRHEKTQERIAALEQRIAQLENTMAHVQHVNSII